MQIAEELIRSDRVRLAGNHSSFYRLVQRGELVRLAHGVYVSTSTWSSWDPDTRHLASVHAFHAASRGDALFGYQSAAAVWGLPSVRSSPSRVHVIRDSRTGHTRRDVIVHGDGHAPTIELDGVTVTTLARTVVDVAARAPRSVAVAMADAALAGRSRLGRALTYEELEEALDDRRIRPGRARARSAIAFADPRAESVGESVSRVAIDLIGAPSPVLQHEFVDDLGSMFSDFWWPEFGLIGEFDGLTKYTDPALRRPGESIADSVMREKRREDRLRLLGPRVARWDWSTAWSLVRLEALLRRAGMSW